MADPASVTALQHEPGSTEPPGTPFGGTPFGVPRRLALVAPRPPDPGPAAGSAPDRSAALRHALALGAAGSALVDAGPGWGVLEATPRLARLTGLPDGAVTGVALADLLAPAADRATFDAAVGRALGGATEVAVTTLLRRDDASWWGEVRLSLAPGTAGTDRLLAVSITDLTERLDSDRQLRRATRLDPAVGLAGRAWLDAELRRLCAGGAPVGVVVLSAGGLAAADARSRAAGDALVRALATTVADTVRAIEPAALVARTVGAELAILLPGPATGLRARTHLLADALEAACGEPVVHQGSAWSLHADAGTAVHPDDAASPDALLAVATAQLRQTRRRRASRLRWALWRLRWRCAPGRG